MIGNNNVRARTRVPGRGSLEIGLIECVRSLARAAGGTAGDNDGGEPFPKINPTACGRTDPRDFLFR